MVMDITTLIFEEILKISPQLMSKYSSLQDQMLYLILIPHVVLLLFIVAFSRGIVAKVLGGHRGFEYLFIISTYLVFILAGWYGMFIVPIMITWFYIGLIVAFGIFVISAVFNPARSSNAMKFFGAAGQKAGEAAGLGKEKARNAYQKEIDNLDAERTALLHRMPTDPSSRSYVQMQISEIDRKIARLTRERDSL